MNHVFPIAHPAAMTEWKSNLVDFYRNELLSVFFTFAFLYYIFSQFSRALSTVKTIIKFWSLVFPLRKVNYTF